MEGGEGWQMITSTGGGVQDGKIIDRIMLRFRPIAPKPANAGLDSGVSETGSKNIVGSKSRKKRKYVRVCKNKRPNQKSKRVAASSPSEKDRDGGGRDREDGSLNNVVTLQLLPDRSDDPNETPENESSGCNLDLARPPTRVENNSNNRDASPWRPWNHDVGDERQCLVVLESWVKVECVTADSLLLSSCMEMEQVGLLGCRDVQKVKANLENDKCPGFISDGSNRVDWVNDAYRKMMMMKDEEYKIIINDHSGPSPEMEMKVRLAIKEELVPYFYYYRDGSYGTGTRIFTCWVRLQCDKWRKEKMCRSSSEVVPCDAWKLENGGFAWRLDFEAALTLGRP